MADLKYTVEVDTSKGLSNLKQLQDQVQKTQDIFSGFQKAIAGLAIGAFIANTVKMAAALDDVATASGIALDNVIGFGQAVAANGGSIEGANQAIGRFAKFIDEAASGSSDAQNKFNELGITFKDLQTLSEADLLRKTISGLASVEDNAKRSALGMQIFGKSFNSVDFPGVNQGLDGFIQRAGLSASAVKAAADAEQNFANAMTKFQYSLLAALEPISKFLAGLDPKAIQAFAETIIELGKVFIALQIATKVASAIEGVALAMRAGSAAAGAMTLTMQAAAGGVFANFLVGLKQIGQGLNIFKTMSVSAMSGISFLSLTLKSLGTGLLRIIPFVGQAYLAFEVLNGILKAITGGGIVDWAQRAAKAIGLISETSKEAADKAKAENDAEIQRLKNRSATAQAEADDKTRRQVAVNTEIAKEKKAALEAFGAYQQQNVELNNKFALQTKLLGMSEEQRLVEEENSSSQERYLKAIEPLRNRILEIQAKGKDATAGELAAIPELQAGIQKITQEYASQEPIRNNLLKNRIDELLKTKEMAYQAELLTKAEERRLAVSDQVRETLLRGPQEAQRAYEEMQLSGMTGVAKKLKEIELEENRLKKASLERIAAQFSNADGEMVDAEGFTRAVNQIEAATKRNIDIRQAAARNIGTEQRSFADGWRKAFSEYRDSATNAATQAGKVFAKFTQGLEDNLINFVKTGKFEWKSFTASILEELLRGQIQKGIASILGPLSELMGLNLSGIGGQAPGSSPNNPIYALVTNGGTMGGSNVGVGGAQQTGGGIGGTIESIFSGVKDAASSVWDGITGAFGGITDAIGNIFGGGGGGGGGFFSGIADLFGGFFANGGMLGAGKFGIAGENGPELISGPASITPMGGQTNVTYNINAVDAASFKAMIAADPSFIHAVAMQGGKSMPRRY